MVAVCVVEHVIIVAPIFIVKHIRNNNMPTKLEEIMKEFNKRFVTSSVFGISIRAIDNFKETGQQQIESFITKACIDFAKSCVPEEKTNEDFIKELNVPISDYSFGHTHGYRICREQMVKNIEGK